MCGRFALYATEQEIISHFGLMSGFSMQPRFNIAPTQTIPVVCSPRAPIEFMRWGFIPSWEKFSESAERLPVGYRNARIESIMEKPAFKKAFVSTRCLIPASGFYEWRTIGSRKQPYFITIKDQLLLGMAGIWSIWQNAQGERYSTCAILTQPATEKIKQVHDRCPVIISSQYYSSWLTAKTMTAVEAQSFFLTVNDQNSVIQAVASRMNRADIEGPECILPL